MGVFNHERKNILLGFFLAFLGTALFSLKSIFIKLAYAEGLETDSVLMLRMAISLPIYLLIIVWLARRQSWPIAVLKPLTLKIILLGFIGYFLASWLDLKGLEYISAGLERLTLFTYPIFIAVLGAMFFHTPLDRRLIVTLLLTYFGLWLIFNQEAVADHQEYLLGVVLVLLSALSYSLYVLFGKSVIEEIGSLWFTALAMSVSSVFVLLYYAILGDWSALTISPMAWAFVTCLAIFSTVIPSFMLNEAIARVGGARTGVVGTLGPVITILLAVVILDEPFSLYHALGTALVIVGVMLLTFKASPQNPSQPKQKSAKVSSS